MKFNKGDMVKLVGYEKSYTAVVTGPGMDDECFSAVIVTSEYDESEYHGRLSVGSYDDDFTFDEFELVEVETNV
jgi:hypothetical protein